jgi:hypothetical protein
MTSLLSKITPLTKGLVWFAKEEINTESSHYREVDYLLNGLLTATLKNQSVHGCHVLVSENFGENFYVLIGHTFSEKEIASYFDILKTQLRGESDLLLIDEINSFALIQKIAPDEIKSKIHVIQ